MKSLIAAMLNRYENGGVTRRDLIQGLAALATAATATTASAAGFEVSGIDHIQINATDAKHSAEWYQKVLGLKPVRAGAMGDESSEIAHVGTSDTLLMSIRRLKPVGKVDHIGFRVTGFNQESVVRDLKARGAVFQPPDPTAAPGSYLHDPDGIRIQLSGKVPMKPY